MNDYETLKDKLVGFGVPLFKIAPLKKRLNKLELVLSQYETLKWQCNQENFLEFADAQRQLQNCEQALSTTVIGLLKKYTGYRVIVCWGGARVKREDPAYLQMVETLSQAGPKTIIIDGCGPGMMEAFLEGAIKAGAIVIGLRMVSDKAFETTLDAAANPWAARHTFCFDHHDFYSRVASFLAFVDAIFMAKCGIGGTQENYWAQGSIQCGMMPPVPIFVFSPEFWEGAMAHFKIMLREGSISQEDLDLFRFVADGEEHKVYDRIDKYYAARPHLILPQANSTIVPPPEKRSDPGKT